MKRDTITGIFCVLGAALFHLSLGYIYTVGNMNPYLISFMGLKTSEVIWFNSVMLACQAVSMPIGGLLSSKIGFRPVVIMATILGSGGVLLSRLTIFHGIGPFIFTYCFMFGFCLGLPYSVLFAVASSWFPNHRATVVGIISSGLGLGALVFSPIQTAFINPNNNQNLTDPSVTKNVPDAFLLLGGIMLGIQILGFCLCREKKHQTNATIFSGEVSNFDKISRSNSVPMKDTSDFSEASIIENVVEINKTTNYTIKEAMKTVDFYLIFSIIFLNVIPTTLQSSYYKVYGKESGLDDLYLSSIATASAVFNCVGRITWGLLTDRFSFKCPLEWLLLQWGLLFVTFPFISLLAAFKYLYAVWVFALFFTLSGTFVIMPAASTRIFGPQHMATIYGLLYLAMAPSTLTMSAILSQFDLEDKWQFVYGAASCCCALGFLISLFLRDEKGTCTGWSNHIARILDRCRTVKLEDENKMESPDDF